MKAISKRNIAIVGVIIAIVIGVGVYAYLKNQQSSDLSTVSAVISRIQKHVLLPTNEEPALITVTDPSKVTTDFLKHTQTGDKVLIYQTNHRAIIYRPTVDKIVDIGPVVIDSPKSN